MKQIETDVAVVGGGAAGLAAAIAAAEKGAKVCIFEKGATTGGTANMGMGPFAVESKLQRAKNITLTKEEAFKIFMDYTHWRVDARLVSNYINKSADTIDWLEKMGVVWGAVEPYVRGSYPTHHQVQPPGGRPGSPMAASAMIKCMTDTANDLGVKLYLKTPAKKLIKEQGKIIGLLAASETEELQVKAKAVIIASGGFGDNPEMIKKYTQYEWGKDLFSMRIPGMAGEGCRMAWEAGAGVEEMNMELTLSVPMDMSDMGRMAQMLMSGATIIGVLPLFMQPNLLVNAFGERFMNEAEMGNFTFLGNAIGRQKGRYGFIVFDSAAVKDYEQNGVDWPITLFQHGNAPVPYAEILKKAPEQAKLITSGNSLDELAKNAGIDAAGLKSTVEEYNKACESGRDVIFHKRASYLRSIKQPPFYAGKLYPNAYGSLGGIKINWKLEAVTKDMEVIPGLYAAGVDANAIYADSYVFVLPGNTMGFAINGGRMAGENAAVYSKTA